jgi:sodium-dependent phosphate cotransporter
LLLFASLGVLLISLILLVKVLSSLLQGAALRAVNRVLNAELPGRLSWLTGYIAMVVGVLFTVVLQSSSVFTSILTPLVGIGVLTIERMYPLTLGANIGTTATSVIAAFAGSNVALALQISLCHLFFNITGVILFYPLSLTRAWPCFIAKKMGNATADHRWFAFAYIVVMFLIMPATVLGLSLGGWQILYGIGLPILTLITTIVITNTLQDSAQSLLPPFLRDWKFLPVYFRSLDPYDKLFTKCSKCQKQKGGSVLPSSDDGITRR